MSYISRIFRTGAVRKTPEKIIKRMLQEITPTPQTSVIEIGAGKGEITRPLLQKLYNGHTSEGHYFALEIDASFVEKLASFLPTKQIITASAFDFEAHIPHTLQADYIVSSMPLSFYSKNEIRELMHKMQSRLKPGGKIIILYHAFWLTPVLKKSLPRSQVNAFFTLPPYFLLIYQK